jgi:hypothetical protein
MRIHVLQPLFAWDALEDSPSLATIRRFLEAVPDERLLASLQAARGKGRDDYPVRVLWGVVLLTPLLRHTSFEACLAELRRNEGLRRLLGIPSEHQVPKKWNISRFLDLLGQTPHREQLEAIFARMVGRLGEAVEDLGRQLAGDATSLNARKTRAAQPAGQSQPAGQADRLPEPCGGRKEYTDEAGHVTKVVEWFGYKLHLLVDVKHEVAVAYQVTTPQRGDNEALLPLLKQAQKTLPEGRIRTLAYDKAADDSKVHQALEEAKITPLIQIRSLWKEEAERPLEGIGAQLPIVYDEAGTVYCYDKVSEPPVRHPMAYLGHEPDRGTLKYRCPARHQGWDCPSAQACNRSRDYGLVVRIDRSLDLRRFPPLPRATKKFERLYKGRTAVERVNARLKVFWGADDGNLAGPRRFFAFVGAVMVVHAGLATVLASTERWEGTLGKLALSPIAEKLRGRLGEQSTPSAPAAVIG